jgi:diadenosine tetraphosphate (Ap4A) HIT family hydrolase
MVPVDGFRPGAGARAAPGPFGRGARITADRIGGVTISAGCFTCANNGQLDLLPPRERVAADAHWRVAHAFDTAVPGWLVLVPLRHVTAIADLTDDEAAGLGRWQVRLSRALAVVTGCVKTYVVQFAEAEDFSHVHFHVVPRMADLPPQRRGPKCSGCWAGPRTNSSAPSGGTSWPSRCARDSSRARPR